ncbi:MAG: VWA domain-containing protein [Kiritimatiellae bacterium]|nr:VWA domain-containing protein [Kiritimatiellia bacterium]
MRFATPLFLLLLLPLAFAAWRLLRRGRRTGIRFSATARLPARTAGWRAKLAALSPFVLLVGLALLVVASARPRTPLAHEKKSLDAIAIAMTVDVSGSMDALDLAPRGTDFRNASRRLEEWTRLSVVKRLFAEFVEKRPDDLIGLVSFGTYASTVVPLTLDHDMLLHALKGVEIPTTSFDAHGNAIGGEAESMTAIGDGLATALLRLKDAKPKSKIVILLSDGVSNTGAVEPADAAATAAKMGIKVYCIGIGTASRQTPMLVRDGFGRYGVDAVRMTFDERQLKDIARATGAMYFPVRDRDSLAKALAEIDTLETTRLEADAYDRWDEHFAAFLAAGALLVFLAVSLSMAASRRLA